MPTSTRGLLPEGDGDLDSFDRLRDAASRAIGGSPVDFLEVRIEKKHLMEVLQVGKELDRATDHRETGAYVRALVDGSWGSAWLPADGNVPEAIELACLLARERGAGPVALAECPASRGVFDPPVIEPLADVTTREKVFLCRRYSELLASTIRQASTRVHFRQVLGARAVLNSRGTDVLERHSLCGLRMEAVGGQHKTHVSRDIAYRGGFEFVRHREDLVEQMVESLAERDTSRTVETGPCSVVIDPQLAGVLVHEAFGHVSEADFLIANPVVSDALRRGRKIGVESLSIVDDATHFGLPGSCAYDDEGVPGQRTQLVSAGRIVDRMHSLETAGMMGEKSTGNARALDHMHPPSVRMSCTYVEPGSRSLDALLGQMGRGLYLRGSLGGATDMSRFSFTAEEARTVSGGRIRKPLRPVTISGRVFDVLMSIAAVGNDLSLHSSIGGCSKGEQRFMPVSYGGPHLLLEGMEVS
ncbi:TldD/PmbA family protein [Candidatus Fermentibacterales bacterium]|nr:TldD/PmbA family protein [Candidatus Fermentibacterales bacterium]